MKSLIRIVFGITLWFFIMSFICGTINFLELGWLAMLIYVIIGSILIINNSDDE